MDNKEILKGEKPFTFCTKDLSQLKYILLKERIVKIPLKYDSISDSEVYEYYVTQNHSLPDTCKHFNCNGQIISDKIHKLGVRKAAPKGYASTITKEELCDYYIINNHTFVETSIYFKISTGTLISLAKILSDLLISEISCSRDEFFFPDAVINCK